MAGRKRSYFAKSNKGKAVEVFWHNTRTSAAQKRKASANERKKQAAQDKRRREAERKRESKALERAMNAENRERKRAEKARAIAEEKQRKFNKKHKKMLDRAKITCEKYGIDPICAGSMVEEAYQHGLGLVGLVKDIIKPNIDKWKEKSIELKEAQYIGQLRISARKIANEHSKERQLEAIFKEGFRRKDVEGIPVVEYLADLSHKFVQDIVELRPNLNEIENTDVYRAYLVQSERLVDQIINKIKIQKVCNELIESGEVLGRFQSEFIKEALEENIPQENIDNSNILLFYKNKSNHLHDEVEEKLNRFKIGGIKNNGIPSHEKESRNKSDIETVESTDPQEDNKLPPSNVEKISIKTHSKKPSGFRRLLYSLGILFSLVMLLVVFPMSVMKGRFEWYHIFTLVFWLGVSVYFYERLFPKK